MPLHVYALKTFSLELNLCCLALQNKLSMYSSLGYVQSDQSLHMVHCTYQLAA